MQKAVFLSINTKNVDTIKTVTPKEFNKLLQEEGWNVVSVNPASGDAERANFLIILEKEGE